VKVWCVCCFCCVRAVRCSVLQCVAVCISALQWVTVTCLLVYAGVVCVLLLLRACSVLQFVTVRCDALWCVAVCGVLV